MKKITLFMGLVLASTMSFSQVIVKLTSVPCNTGLEGTYPYEYAGELDGSSTDWGLPNIFDGNNSVTGPLELVNDGTPGTAETFLHTPPNTAPYPNPPLSVSVPASACGCDTLGNLAQDMTGKIAVVYRGACAFSLKALNAQKRGAAAVIIINHTGDAVGMAGGPIGPRVTIPVVMVGRVAGDDLFLALNTCAPNSVTGFIGSKVGVFNDDMGSSIADIVMPESSAVPADLAVNGTFDLGYFAFNYGINAQNGVTASVEVKQDGNTIHTNTTAPLNFAAPAGTVIDTQYFDLGTFNLPKSNGTTVDVASYEITYTLNITTTDEDPADNEFKVIHRVTNNEDIFAKSTTNAAGIPVHNTAFSLNEESTAYDDWEACITYRGPYTGIVEGMYFTGEPVGTDIDYEVVEIRAYQWTEAGYTDLSVAAPTFANLTQLASASYFWDHASNGNLEGEMVYVPFDVALDMSVVTGATDLKGVLFCVYNASDSVRIGFDTKINYLATVNQYLQPISPVKTLPNGQAATWYAAGFGYESTAAIAAKFAMFVGTNNVSKNVVSTPYPNPAANLLTVPVRRGVVGDVTVKIYDLAGKLVISEKQTIGSEPLKVNVASIANGAYVFNLTFADGSSDTFKVSVNR